MSLNSELRRGAVASGAWSWVRGLCSALMFVIGSFGATAALNIHRYRSGYRWQSDRYFMERHGWGWEIVDPIVAFVVGGVFVARLSWLLVSAFASRAGQALPASKAIAWDTVLLGVNGVVLTYLIYVSNVRDLLFWPIAILLTAALLLSRR